MSVIAIVIERDAVPASLLMKLSRILNTTLQTLKSVISARNPIVELEIFDGDYHGHAKIIRAVIAFLNEEGVGASFYEIPYGQKFADNAQLQTWKVNSSFVEDVLKAADNEVSRQLDM